MVDNQHAIFYAKTLAELFYQTKSIAGLRIVGGCTALRALPEKILSIRKIPELLVIDKHERYINFGTAVTLSDIIDVGSTKLPQVFMNALRSIANPLVRNMATIGGNVCNETQRMTLYAPLLALDAQIELRSPTATLSQPLLNFKGIPNDFVATHIRVPLSEWEVSIFRRIGPSHIITQNSASFTFLTASERSVITDIKIALAGPVTFRALQLENKLIGARLPLNQNSVLAALLDATAQYDAAAADTDASPLLRRQFITIMQDAFDQLT